MLKLLPVLKSVINCRGEGAAYASIGSGNELNLNATVEALGKELTITAWQVGNHNYLPSDTVVYTVIIRKTIAEFCCDRADNLRQKFGRYSNLCRS